MPVTAEEADREIDAFRKEFPGLSTINIIHADTPEELYGTEAGRKLTGVKGAFLPQTGRVDLFCANNRDTSDLRETLLHEAVGHYGTLTFAEPQKRDLLDATLRSRQSFSLKADWDFVDQEYADKSELLKAEEVFCLAAERVDGRTSQSGEEVSKLWREVIHDKARPLEAGDLQIIANAVADGLARNTRQQQIFPLDNNSIFRTQQDMIPDRATAFRNDPPEKALAKHPELKPVYKSLGKVEKMLKERFPNDENRRQHYMAKVREEIGRQLDAGKLPSPAPEKARPTRQSQPDMER